MRATVRLLVAALFFVAGPNALGTEPATCVLAGFHIGDAFPARPDRKQFRSSNTKFLEPLPEGASVFRLATSPDDTSEFVAVKDGRVVAIVRELNVDQLNQYFAALTARYGDPIGAGGQERHALGSIVTVKDRATWISTDCGAAFELVKRTRALGTIIRQSAALVVTPAPSGDDLLK